MVPRVPQGEKGDPGADGADGATGPQGPKGDKGDPGAGTDPGAIQGIIDGVIAGGVLADIHHIKVSQGDKNAVTYHPPEFGHGHGCEGTKAHWI